MSSTHRVFLTVGVFLTLASFTLAQTPPAQDLIHVEISGLRSDKGKVMCALFSSAATSPNAPTKQ
jgi:uncharacterized protein (DUF2141 family)